MMLSLFVNRDDYDEATGEAAWKDMGNEERHAAPARARQVPSPSRITPGPVPHVIGRRRERRGHPPPGPGRPGTGRGP